jgi:hypothetical protein
MRVETPTLSQKKRKDGARRGSAKSVGLVESARGVLAVALDFEFILILRIFAVGAAILFVL